MTNIVELIAEIFESQGSQRYLGEPVTMAEHMLQAAAEAESRGRSEAVIAAALLHDIGHFHNDLGIFSVDDVEDRYHEKAGADLLEPFFPEEVVDCVRHHVAAKRYLCATRPTYHARLSEASKISLRLQGGPMTEEEVAEFERLPHLSSIVEVRQVDDSGKEAGRPVPSFAHFTPLLEKLVGQKLGSVSQSDEQAK